MADIRCPKCHELDQVSKVTAIVSAGTSRGTSANAAGHAIETRGQTDLSAALAPPAAPSRSDTQQGAMLWKGCIGYLAFLGGAILCMSIFILIPEFFNHTLSNSLVYIVGIVVGLILLGSFYALHRNEKGSFSRQQARFEEEMEVYRVVRQKWEQLYYCFRDDGVFLPDGQSELIPKRELRVFLYR